MIPHKGAYLLHSEKFHHQNVKIIAPSKGPKKPHLLDK